MPLLKSPLRASAPNTGHDSKRLSRHSDWILGRFVVVVLVIGVGLTPAFAQRKAQHTAFYPSTKPLTRWWWFATEIKEADIRHQLDWARENQFGGVEIAWVYPLYRYKDMYAKSYGRYYPKDSSAQKWLSPEWQDIVAFTKHYADSIGLACDFTFGSAWPVASSDIPPTLSTQVYGDTAFRQKLTFSWEYPTIPLVINHLDSNAFHAFAEPIGSALSGALEGNKSALFTDSWEIKLNDKLKIWTPGFEKAFLQRFGYDLIPFMERGLDSFPDVRYDYMMVLGDMVLEGFYKPYARTCRRLGAWSRVQCLGAPTDVMTAYSLVDIPETECMLNDPNYSKVVSSAAALSGKPMVSSETFTCMYGFPATFLRREQAADLKMVADAMFAQGVNQHIYHGMPYNPKGSDSIVFFATTYFGPGGSLEPDLPAFNSYIERVSGIMQRGKTYSDVAVYLPYEDAVVKGAYPKEKQRVWVWGEYELRYIHFPELLRGHHPLWINRVFLEKAKWKRGRLQVGDAKFTSLYLDVEYLDARSLDRILELAQQGLPVCIRRTPLQPGHEPSSSFAQKLTDLMALPNVSANWEEVCHRAPLVTGDSLPEYWCRLGKNGIHNIFFAQPLAQDLAYPIYGGQSFMASSVTRQVVLNVNGHRLEHELRFEPYQSILLQIDKRGNLKEIDIRYVPPTPEVRPREPQKSYF